MTNASSYYFTSNDVTTGVADGCKGIYFSFLKHSGSIALGSAVRVLVSILRLLIDSTTNNNKQDGGEGVLGSCLGCCMGCMEDVVDYCH